VPKDSKFLIEFILLEMVIGVSGCIQLLEGVEVDDDFYYVMERPERYTDLYDLVDKKHGLNEEEARKYFRQIVEATVACHEVGVLHRDLKEQNIVVDLENGKIKLINFGLGTFMGDDNVFTKFSGTLRFAPPEWFLTSKYDGIQATVWSLGVLLFSIVCNRTPFGDETEICGGKLSFPVAVSPLLHHLIAWMLSKNPNFRPTLSHILKHKWLQENMDS